MSAFDIAACPSRPARHGRRYLLRAAILVFAVVPCAGAGQPVPTTLDLSGVVAGLPPAADTGKPAVVPPVELVEPEPNGCVPALPCGTRLLGSVRKDGTVELQVPALHW